MKQKKFREIIRFLDTGFEIENVKNFCVDMTFLADKGYYDSFYVRKDIVDKVIVSLCRKNKSNVLLIGEPGVGKTAIVENLAFKIARKEVPLALMNKKVLSLNLSKLVAGTKYRGDLEERFEMLISEIQKSSSIILFIDEIHNIFNTGPGMSGGLDIANIIKPVLAREHFNCIGATTTREYNQFFAQRDPALARRFQNIHVEEMSKKETFDLLKSIKKDYERFHCVKYDNTALQMCIELCDRYIIEKKMPDKVLDFIDSLGAYLANIYKDFMPEEVSVLISQINVLKENKIDAFNKLDIVRAEKIIQKIKDKQEVLNKILFQLNSKHEILKVSKTSIIDFFIQYTGLKMIQFKKWKNIQILKNSLQEVRDQEKIIDDLCMFFYSVFNEDKKKNFLCTLLFTGAPGSGKTHMVKVLKNQFFSNDKNYFALDCDSVGLYNKEELDKIKLKMQSIVIGLVHFYNFSHTYQSSYSLIYEFLSNCSQMLYGTSKKNLIVIIESNFFNEQHNNIVGFYTQPDKNTDVLNKLTTNFQWDIVSEVYNSLEKFLDRKFLLLIDKVFVFANVSSDTKQKIVIDVVTSQINKINNLMGVHVKYDNGFYEALQQIYSFSEISPKSILKILNEEVFDKIKTFVLQAKLVDTYSVINLYFDENRKISFFVEHN